MSVTLFRPTECPRHYNPMVKKQRHGEFKLLLRVRGGAAHLPGMLAANTLLPVIGVPIKTHTLNGVDSLLSIVQMPAGVPVATMAIGDAGAKNGALMAAQIIGLREPQVQHAIGEFRARQRQEAEQSERQF